MCGQRSEVKDVYVLTWLASLFNYLLLLGSQYYGGPEGSNTKKKQTQIKKNLWPYGMIRLWDSKEVFHTKSNICHFPPETVPQLLKNRAAWEKPSNGTKTQPWSSVPSCFPVYFGFNFYLRFLFLFFIWVVSQAQS